MRNLFALDERERKLDRIGDPLAALDVSVDFVAIAKEVEALLPVVDYSKGGRPPFSVLLMVKLLVLKQLYIAKVRARVEHVFAGLHQMGGLLVRTIGMARADFQITTKLAVCNLKRWVGMRNTLPAQRRQRSGSTS
jgi:hypothetical protein